MRKFFTAFLLFAIQSASFAQHPVLEDYWWQPDGPVTSIEFDTIDNKLYLGGLFNSVSANINGNVFLSKETGYPETRFPKIVGTHPAWYSVNASVNDGFGGWYMGGYFDMAGDSSRSRIAHVKANGEVSDLFKNLELNGSVSDMVLDNDTLFVCGNFTGIGKVIKNVTAFDRDSGLVKPGFPETNGQNIFEIISDDSGGWFMSGDFTLVGDSIRNRFVHLNEMFQIMNLNLSTNGIIYSMVLSDSILYLGGTFSEINGLARNSLAAVNINTGILTSFAPVVNGWVLRIALSNNKLCFLGQMNSVNSISTGNFAIVDAMSGATISENIALSNFVDWEQCDMLVQSDTLYVGGHFTEGIHSNLMAVDLTTNSILTWNPIIDSTVTNIEWHNDSLLVSYSYFNGAGIVRKIDPVTGLHNGVGNMPGGILDMVVAGDTLFMGSYETVPGNSLQAIDLTTNGIIDWNPIITGLVYALCAYENTVVAGGSQIEAVDGVNKKYVAAYDINTENLIEWSCPSMNSDGAGSIFVDGDKIYVGGGFNIVGDSVRYKIVQLNRTDGSVTSWKGISLGSSGEYVWEIFVDHSTIFVGGNISYQGINGPARNLAMLNKTTGLLQPWNISTNNYYGIHKILPVNNQLFIAGGFDSIGGQNYPFLASIDPDNGSIIPLNITLNGAVRDLSFDGDLLYMIGSFDTINGMRRNGICAYDLNLDTLTSWNPNPSSNYTISHINALNNKVFVSGVGEIGRIQRKNFVALDVFTGQPTNLNPDPNKQVYSIVYNDDNIYISGKFDTICNTARNIVACIDKNTGILNSWDPVLNSSDAIHDMHIQSGKLFVGGAFGTIDGQLRRSIAAFNLPSNTLDSFQFDIYHYINDLDIRSDTVYIVGHVNTVPGSNIGVVGVNFSTGQQITLNSSFTDDVVNTVSVAGDKIILAGDFDLIAGLPRKRLAAFDIATGNLSTWDPFWTNFSIGSLSSISTSAVYDSILYVGGGFSFPGSVINPPRYNIASMNINTGLITDWNPWFNATVNELKVSGSSLYIGGSFHENANVYRRKNFVALRLKQGLKIYPVPDQSACGSDTLSPVSLIIEDPFDVNTVLLEAFSSDTNLVQPYNISFSGIGANRNVTVILNPGFTGVCTIGIKATSQSGEIDYSYFNITNHVVQFSLPVGISICQGNTGILDAGPGFSGYLWNTGDLTQAISISQPGVYTVTVTNVHGCTSSDTTLVSVMPAPSVFITAFSSTDICQGDSVLLSAPPGFSSYQWMKNGVALIGSSSEDLFAKLTGTYTCEITDSNGCAGLSNNIKVKIVCIPIGPSQEKLEQLNDNQVLIATILPNPSMNDFQLKIECNDHSSTVISVYDSQHRIVQSGDFDFNGDFYTIRKMSPGVYFVEIRCGKQFVVKKIVQMD